MVTANDLRFQIHFDLVTDKLVVEDLLKANYVDYGTNPDSVEVILRIIDPYGIIYDNSGYPTDDFTTPNIEGATPTWSFGEIVLRLDTNGDPVQGNYTIHYKMKDIDSGNIVESVKSFNLDYTDGAWNVTIVSSCQYSTLDVDDLSEHDVILGTVKILPTTVTKLITVGWPKALALSDSTSTSSHIQVGPNVYTGDYDVFIEATSVYELAKWDDTTWVYMTQKRTYEKSHEIRCDDCSCDYISCIDNLSQRYELAKTTNQREAERLNGVLVSLDTNWMLYQMTQMCGGDYGKYCANIQEIAKSEDCVCPTTDPSEPKEVIPWSSRTTSTSTSVSWYYGTTPPSDVIGENGDFYIDTTSGWLYTKTGGTWVFLIDMQGDDGQDGVNAASMLYNDMTSTSTSAGTGEEILSTFVLHSDAMKTNGDVIEIDAIFEVALDANDKTMRLYFGANQVAEFICTGSVSVETSLIKLHAVVNRKSSSQQLVEFETVRGGSPDSSYGGLLYNLITTDLTSPVTITARGMNGIATADLITLRQLKVTIKSM